MYTRHSEEVLGVLCRFNLRTMSRLSKNVKRDLCKIFQLLSVTKYETAPVLLKSGKSNKRHHLPA